MGAQVLKQSQTAQNLIIGPIVQTSDHSTPMTGLLAGQVNGISATATGSTTTIVTAVSPASPAAVVGNTVTALTGTAGNIGHSGVITGITGTGPYTTTITPALPNATATADTFAIFNTVAASGNGSTTTIVLAANPTVVQGQVIQATSGTNTGLFTYVQSISGSGPFTITVAPALSASTATNDTFTVSDLILNLSKNGAAFATPVAASVVETGKGYYYLSGNATDTNTLGLLNISWAVSGFTVGDSNEKDALIVAYDPLSSTSLGLSSFSAVGVASINGSTAAAARLSTAAATIIAGVVTNAIPTSTTFIDTAGLSTYTTNSALIGRVVYFVSGSLKGQVQTITAYNGSTFQVTTNAFTGAPSTGDAYIIL